MSNEGTARPGQFRIANIAVTVTRVGTQPASVRHIHGPADAGRLLLETAPQGDEREHCRIVILDVRNRVRAIHTVSVGTLTSSLVHPREVFRPAILAGANAIVISHNHPSGDPTPSREDLVLTERLAAAGQLLGIEVMDHIITGEGRFISIRHGLA